MDPRICATLPVFHALTGCDTVSAFSGRGKKTAWNTWEVFPEVTEAFEDLDMSEATMALLEPFVVLLYDHTSDIMNVNDARKQRSTQKSRSLENLPPSQETLKQHIKRACFGLTAGTKHYFPIQCFPPSAADWGWKLSATGWQPLWTILPEASLSCYELIHCGCKKGCTTRQCKCVKAALQCTALCS